MKSIKTLIALSCAASFAVNAEVRINGFANLIGGITSSDETLYGYDDNISFSEESLFAIQVSGDINDKMTATGQLVARGIDDYDPDFEWAYLTYQATDNVSVSAGRLRLPLFRYSASLDVGYSYHWVTAPPSVYNVPFNNIDGVRFDYSNYAGDWEYNLQLAAGAVNSDGTVGKIEGSNTIVLTAEAAYEWFKVRGVYGRSKITITPEGPGTEALIEAFAGLTQLGLTGLVDDLAVDDDTGEFLGFGIEADMYDWFVAAEMTSVTLDDTFIPEDVAYYVTAGMRVGKFTPSVTYENKDGEEDIKFLQRLSGVPAQLQPTVTGIVTAVQQSQFEKFDVLTLGLRYDYDTNIALKADVTKYGDDLNGANDTTLVRFGVNYVF